MKISVALCTYNGDKFLREQIDSILSQTRSVEEIVVCDDRSQDSTVQILGQYQKKFPDLFTVKFNEQNLKSVKNFEKAISLCTGDLIFLSDQDDVWKPNKVEQMAVFMENNSKIDVLCSSADIIDDYGSIKESLTVWDIPFLAKKSNREIDYFTLLSRIQNIATGATMCIRKDFAHNAVPFPIIPGFHHDEWLALLASKNSAFEILSKKLISYRLHQSQQVGGVCFRNTKDEIKKQIENFTVYSAKPTFSVLKKRLKRLSSAYKKYQEITATGFEKDWMKHEVQEIKTLFNQNKQLIAQKFPLQNFILSLADKKNKKRRID